MTAIDLTRWSAVQAAFHDVVKYWCEKFERELNIKLKGRETAILWLIYNRLIKEMPATNTIEFVNNVMKMNEEDKAMMVIEAIHYYVPATMRWWEMSEAKRKYLRRGKGSEKE